MFITMPFLHPGNSQRATRQQATAEHLSIRSVIIIIIIIIINTVAIRHKSC